MQLPALTVVLLPIVTPFIGTTIAAALSQDHWPAWLNDGLAWLVLLTIAAIDMWANGQFSGGWLEVAGDAIQVLTLISSGWLVKLAPWLLWLSWLQKNVFNLLPLLEQIEGSKPTPVNVNPARIAPTAIPLPPTK